MEISIAFALFVAGALSHAFAIRLFKIYTKTLFYKMTYINSLAILKFADSLSQALIDGCENNDADTTSKAFEHWRKLALYSLRVCIPDDVWRQMSVSDWRSAMKLLQELEKEQ